jgi:outer membrane protein assembly factor BamB
MTWTKVGVGLCVFRVLGFECAAEWLHYRGPSKNGVFEEEFPIAPKGALREIWKTQVGVGSASLVLFGGRLFTAGHAGGKEIVRCLDAETGREQWKHAYPASLDPNLFEGGARATPTVSKHGVFALGHEGHLHCLDPETGAVRWVRHLVKDFGGIKPEWGFSGAPFVHEDRVFVDVGGAGGSTIALDAVSGRLIWRSGLDKIAYAGPLMFDFNDQSTLVLFKADSLVGCRPGDGRELWRYPWKTDYNVHAASPLPIGTDRVLISSGYNAGACLLRIGGGKVTELWRNKSLRCHINSPTVWGDYVFGIDGNTGGGNLVCLHAGTGVKQWEEKSVKGGAVVVAGGKLICVSEKGDLIVAEASGSGFKQILRQPALKQRTWAQPLLAGGRVYLRDNAGNLVCLGL